MADKAKELVSTTSVQLDRSRGGIEAVRTEESIWLTQKMMYTLQDMNMRTVNEHLKKIFADSELQDDSGIRKFRIPVLDF